MNFEQSCSEYYCNVLIDIPLLSATSEKKYYKPRWTVPSKAKIKLMTFHGREMFIEDGCGNEKTESFTV